MSDTLRRRVPRSVLTVVAMSLNAGVPWRVTTRIISSGVTPLAHSAAIKAPADVPTYTSNWLIVLLIASRSSARSAPISYTPPVKPPPPSTSAVLSGRGLRRRSTDPGRPTPRAANARALRWAAAWPAAVGSSLTTLPMAASLYGQLARKPHSRAPQGCAPGLRAGERARAHGPGGATRRAQRGGCLRRQRRRGRRQQPVRAAGWPQPPARARGLWLERLCV